MFWWALSSCSRSPEPNAVSMPPWPPRIAPSEPFNAFVISSVCALNKSNAALPAPLNFPSSGSAAWTSQIACPGPPSTDRALAESARVDDPHVELHPPAPVSIVLYAAANQSLSRHGARASRTSHNASNILSYGALQAQRSTARSGVLFPMSCLAALLRRLPDACLTAREGPYASPSCRAGWMGALWRLKT